MFSGAEFSRKLIESSSSKSQYSEYFHAMWHSFAQPVHGLSHYCSNDGHLFCTTGPFELKSRVHRSRYTVTSFRFQIVCRVTESNRFLDGPQWLGGTVLFLLPRPRYIGGRGIVFDRFFCLFIYLYLSLFISWFLC